MIADLNTDEKRTTGYNSTFAIGGLLCSTDTFVLAESLVLRINICGKNPAHRKSAKRWQQPYVCYESKVIYL
jgi:hypothetical protein